MSEQDGIPHAKSLRTSHDTSGIVGLFMTIPVTEAHIERARLEGRDKLLGFAFEELFEEDVTILFRVHEEDQKLLEGFAGSKILNPCKIRIYLLGFDPEENAPWAVWMFRLTPVTEEIIEDMLDSKESEASGT